MNKSTLKKMFSQLCCSECRHDFDDDSIKILREEKGLYVIQVVCNNCKKAFGIAFLGFDPLCVKSDNESDLALEIQDGPPPINYDEVIEAHKFIQNLEHDWQKHIPSEFKD